MLSDDEIDSIEALVALPADDLQAALHAIQVDSANLISRHFRESNLPMAAQHRWPMEKFLLSQREELPSQKAYRDIFRKLRRKLAS